MSWINEIPEAIRAVAPRAPEHVVQAMGEALPQLAEMGLTKTHRRMASLIGQCAHESGGFLHSVEGMHYRTAERIMAVWPSRFKSLRAAQPFTRNAQALGNKVYANRMGNGAPGSGDGFRYRGRGWIQLTGRANYRRIGDFIDIDLEAQPSVASEPDIAWLIAGAYYATRVHRGKPLMWWCDKPDEAQVSRAINGGTHGLNERLRLTERARVVLSNQGRGVVWPVLSLKTKDIEQDATMRLQEALTRAGLPCGPIDGWFGDLTDEALRAFQARHGLKQDGICGPVTWGLIKSLGLCDLP